MLFRLILPIEIFVIFFSIIFFKLFIEAKKIGNKRRSLIILILCLILIIIPQIYILSIFYLVSKY
jgi:hypothetical protein